jgi:hypothetical protein
MANLKKLIGNAMNKATSLSDDGGKMKTKSLKLVPYKNEDLNYKYSEFSKDKKGIIKEKPILPSQFEKAKANPEKGKAIIKMRKS